MEAHAVRSFLAGYDIEAEVAGDNNAFEVGFSLTPNSAPCVFVSDADFERANSLLVEFSDRPDTGESRDSWTCPKCHQVNEAQFDACWRCGATLVDVADDDSIPESEETVEADATKVKIEPPENLVTTLPAPAHSGLTLYFEMIIVAAATMPIFGGYSLFTLTLEACGLHSQASNFYLPSIIRDLLQVGVVLAAIRLSGDHWSMFGLKKPASVDLVTACIVCFVAGALTQMGLGMFLDFLKWMFGERYVVQLMPATREHLNVHGWTGLVTLLVLSIVIGFTEELLMRGYFFTRLEQLLRSTWAAVLLSSAIFGLMHWYGGPFTMCHAFLAGLVYAISFAWSRTLWPVVVAHAAYDFSVLMHRAF
jgi:membrane protease YdiL (CAAX protease family)